MIVQSPEMMQFPMHLVVVVRDIFLEPRTIKQGDDGCRCGCICRCCRCCICHCRSGCIIWSITLRGRHRHSNKKEEPTKHTDHCKKAYTAIRTASPGGKRGTSRGDSKYPPDCHTITCSCVCVWLSRLDPLIFVNGKDYSLVVVLLDCRSCCCRWCCWKQRHTCSFCLSLSLFL